MSLLMKERPGCRASLLRPARAHSAAPNTNTLRVAQMPADPGTAPSTSGSTDPQLDLFATLYAQLRQIAQSALRRSGPQLTVSPTTLLHEAYLKISALDALQFPDRA